MARKEFSKKIRVAVIKRAMKDNGIVYCEKCNLPAKKFEIDHEKPDAMGGEAKESNAVLLCIPCHAEKTKVDVKTIAKSKRVEAKHLGAKVAKTQIKSRGFAKKEKKEKIPLPPRRGMFE